MVDPSDGAPFAAIARGNAADVDAAVRAAQAARDGAWGRLAPAEKGRLLGALGRAILEHAEELALDRGARLRQAAEAGARGRRGVRALLRVLRRRVRQAARRDDPVSGGIHRAHVARAARRHRPRHPVELSAADLRPLGRRCARRRQRMRGQAGRGRLPVAVARRGAGRRRGPSRGRAQHRDGARRGSGRGARRAHGNPAHLVHRVAGDGRVGRGGRGEAPLSGHARAGRQVAADRVRRRGPRRGAAGARQRDRAERRPDVLRGQPAAGGALALRGGAGAPRRALRRAEGGPGAGGSAIAVR